MKLTKSLLSILIGALIGGIAIFLYMKKENAQVVTKLEGEIAGLKNQITIIGEPPVYEFRPMPSSPIESLYAQNLIRNYNCGTTRLQNTDGATLKGWHIEKHLIDSLFGVYEDRGVTGLQVYLGKHEEVDNKSHTLIWMAVKDTTEIIQGRTMESMKLLIDRPKTIFQYVKPCPINCPKNDFQINCGG